MRDATGPRVHAGRRHRARILSLAGAAHGRGPFRQRAGLRPRTHGDLAERATRREIVSAAARRAGRGSRAARRASTCAWCGARTVTRNWQGIGGQQPDEPRSAGAMALRIDGVADRGRPHLVRRRNGAAAHRGHGASISRPTRSRAASRSRTRSFRGAAHGRFRARRRAIQRSRCPGPSSPKTFSSLAVEEFELDVRRARSGGRRAGNARRETQPVRAGVAANRVRSARAAGGGRHRAAEDHRSERARQACRPPRTWSFDDGAISVDPLALTLDDTHFDGQLPPRCGRTGGRRVCVRAATRSTSRATFRRPIPRASPSCCRRRCSRPCGSAARSSSSRRRSYDIVMKGVTLRLLLDEQGLRSEAAASEAMTRASIAARLLAWHAQSGRHDLPWQRHLGKREARIASGSRKSCCSRRR